MNQHPTADQLREWLDGRLNEADSQAIETHLAMCSGGCTTVLEQLSNETIAPPPQGGPSSSGSAAPSRYRTLRPLKRGGLGEVFVALDEELQREVALKKIQEKHADNPDSRGRFVLEAEVTGRLEHPGVVPVYGLGLSPDGRPYYAMRFIKGESFSDAITRFHAADTAGRDPGERSLAFRELLRRFTDLCNAIAYAHSKGVLHRDLKPDNVMLGAFGETLVIDWGLAKVLGAKADDSAPGSVFTSAATDQLDKTHISGTPPYMSPEQAEGAVDSLGAATDVYSLGAILYELLAGQRAFPGKEVARVLKQVLQGQFTPPRQVKASAPRALEAVCLKAMARLPENRYASARDLAADVNRWLADEPVTAWREPWRERTRRWTRQHRTLMTSLSVLLLTTTVTLAVGLGLVNAEKNRTKHAEEETKSALERVTQEQAKTKEALAKVTEEQGKTQAALEKSRTAEANAKEQRQLALDTVKSVVNDIEAQLRDRPALQELRKKLLKTAESGLKKVARNAETIGQIDHEAIWVHFELGEIFLRLDGATAEAQKEFKLAHALAVQRADADKGDTQAQRDLSISLGRLGDMQVQLGDTEAALVSCQRSLDIAQQRADADRSNAEAQRDLLLCLERLGDVQFQLGDTKAALGSFQWSLDIAQQRADADKGDALAQRDLSVSLERLGNMQLQLGDTKAALASRLRSLDIDQKLADADKGNTHAQRDLSVGLIKLGSMQVRMGDTKAALASYQRSLDIFQQLADADKGNALAQHDLSFSLESLGDAQLQLVDTKAALASYRRSQDIRKKLADADKGNALAQRDLSFILKKVGDMHLQLRDTRAALASYQQSLDIAQKLADADKGNVQAQRSLSISLNKVGDVQLQLGDTKAALGSYQRSLVIFEKLADADNGNAEAQRDLLANYNDLGRVMERSRSYKEAVEWYKKALDVPKRFPRPEFFKQEVAILTKSLTRCQLAEQAIADLDFAMKQAPGLVPQLLEIRIRVWLQKGKHAEVAATADKFHTLPDLLGKPAGQNIYYAACGYALASTCADANDKTKEFHAVHAVALLKEARDKAFFKAKSALELAKKDTDLDPLRQRDDFKALLAELDKDAK